MSFNLVSEATASSDGSFHIPAFRGAECTAIRLYAEKPDDLWLKTGANVFYKGEIGTTPLVNVTVDGLPSHADIELGIRGGRVKLRVKDTGSGKPIWAEVRLELVPPVDFHAGSIQTATGRDGSPVPLFVPAGEYRVSVLQYACGTVDFFARRPPAQVFVVAEGERLEKDINVDIQHIEAMKSYSNPQGRTCRL